MHRSQVFRTLILKFSFFLFFTSVVYGAPVNVYSEFNKKIAKLETDLSQQKNVSARYKHFLKAYAELSDLRAKNPRQAETDELNMSLFMETLSYFPESKKFKASQCPEYKKEIVKMMKSYQKEQKEPFVEKALHVVDLICR